MYRKFSLVILITEFIILKAIGSANVFAQEEYPDIEALTLQDDLSSLSECSAVVEPDHPLLRYCKNNSICRLLDNKNGYLHAICDCTSTITDTHYYTGPRCETRIPINYRSNVSGLLNTCWLEDLLGLNSWKNDFTRVGSLY